MKISQIEVWSFCPGFRDGPYAMSHVVMDAVYGRQLRVRTTTGVTGLGEVVFGSAITKDESEAIFAREPNFLSSLVGQQTESLAVLARELRKEGKTTRGVAFALETALLDIRARSQNKSLADLLGGALTDSVDSYFSVSERNVARVRDRIALAGPTRAVIQLKLGIGAIEEDVSQVAASLDVMNHHQLLLADANGGWTVDSACNVIRRFDDARIIWEEPCDNYDDNVQVARLSGRPVMFDQCIADADLARRAVTEGVAGAVCIKPGFLGGLLVARDIRDRCAKASLKMRIDGPWCGDIASAAALHLAMGAPPHLLIAGCDLREPLVIEPDLRGVVYAGDTRIAPPRGIGLGINLGERTLGEPVAVYD